MNLQDIEDYVFDFATLANVALQISFAAWAIHSVLR